MHTTSAPTQDQPALSEGRCPAIAKVCPRCASTRVTWLPNSAGWRALWWDWVCDSCGCLWS